MNNNEPPSFRPYKNIIISGFNSPTGYCSIQNEADWSFLGPKILPAATSVSPNGMGFVNVVEYDYSDLTGNTFYAGGVSGGLWKTTNGGTNWTCLTDNTNLSALGIGDIAIDPNDPSVIYNFVSDSG
jgi:hypothetical protein